MYLKHPKAMLRSRAITAGLKSVGWEGGSGVYDPSELAIEPAPAEGGVGEVESVPTITEKQRALLEKLSRSHVITETERARLLAVDDKETAKKAIDWATATIAERKAEPEGAELQADDVDANEVAA
jgi:hypothetical protein